MTELETKLTNLLYECSQHKKRLSSAYQKIKHYLPFTIENYAYFNEDEIEHIDQFLFRFAKLQDTLGEKLFATLLILLNENIANKPFIDILNKLERLELLDKNEWMELRQVRNSVAHEYSLNTEEIVESLNTIYDNFPKLMSIYETIDQYCIERFDFVKNRIVKFEVESVPRKI